MDLLEKQLTNTISMDIIEEEEKEEKKQQPEESEKVIDEKTKVDE